MPGGTDVPGANDRFDISGTATAEGSIDLQQGLTTSFGGWPTWMVPLPLRNSIGLEPFIYGNALQTQTVGVGDGSKTTFCSASNFCPNNSVAKQLIFNAASLTGSTITAKIDNGSGGAGNILTTSAYKGALEPLAVLTDLTGNITGSPVIQTCLTGCVLAGSGTPSYCVGNCYPSIQTWAISGSPQLVASETMRADTPQTGGTPWPSYTQILFPPLTSLNVKAGTFQILVNGTVVCQDTTIPMVPYNNQGGNCIGSGVDPTKTFVNFQTGDYQVTFTSPPGANAVITASWTDVASVDVSTGTTTRPAGYDFVGDGTPNVGYVTANYSKSPGGVNAHLFMGGITFQSIVQNPGYPFGVGAEQAIAWLSSTRYPSILPGVTANTPVLFGGGWGVKGPVSLTTSGDNNAAAGNLDTQFDTDLATNSTFSGTMATPGGVPSSSGVLTLTTAATGRMWGRGSSRLCSRQFDLRPWRSRAVHPITGQWCLGRERIDLQHRRRERAHLKYRQRDSDEQRDILHRTRRCGEYWPIQRPEPPGWSSLTKRRAVSAHMAATVSKGSAGLGAAWPR